MVTFTLSRLELRHTSPQSDGKLPVLHHHPFQEDVRLNVNHGEHPLLRQRHVGQTQLGAEL